MIRLLQRHYVVFNLISDKDVNVQSTDSCHSVKTKERGRSWGLSPTQSPPTSLLPHGQPSAPHPPVKPLSCIATAR